MTARGGYREAVTWIALNDNAGNGDAIDDIAGYISTCLVADLFRKEPYIVACAIMRERQRIERDEKVYEAKS